MAIEAAYMVPHPPMILPRIGKGAEGQIQKTVHSFEQIAEEIAGICPETLIILSPHAVMYADYFHISPGKSARGDFGRFGAGEVRFEETLDEELVREIDKDARRDAFPAGTLGERDRQLDHGVMVPLYFIREKTRAGRIVRIGLSGLPLSAHYELGQRIRAAVEHLGRRAVVVASGDLSHKLQTYGPYGFAREGPEYDARLMDVCRRGAFGELLEFDEAFCERAAECGHRSFVIMAGALDGREVEARVLSHEDVTGVGYGVCAFRPGSVSGQRRFLETYREAQKERIREIMAHEDPYVRLARLTVESFVREGRKPALPEWVTPQMRTEKAGVFVSIHARGRLRGCIGTIGSTRSCIAEEIRENAVSAAMRDPRFDPVREDELPFLEIHVDVLSRPERIGGREELDVKRYGVIVSSGGKRGLLLPDLEGVDTVEEQIRIAMQKGGIGAHERITLERFEVVRHR